MGLEPPPAGPDRALHELRMRIGAAVGEHAADSVQHTKLIEVLQRPGYALHPRAPCRSGMLTLGAYGSIRGSLDGVALSAAAAVEIQTAAAFLFDNVADAHVRNEIGCAEELALAIALSECASCVACEAIVASGRGAAGVRALIEFHRTCVAASAGQLLDALFERRHDVTTDEALEMTCLKSGSLGRFAGGFGARVATDDPELVAGLEDLGHVVFTFAQLVDDLRDACATDGGDDDLARHKKTVPLAFFYNLAGRPRSTGTMSVSRQSARRDYETCGAWLFGALVAESFLDRARTVLQELGEKRCAVNDLERLVGSLTVSFQSVLGSVGASPASRPRAADRRLRARGRMRVPGSAGARLDAPARESGVDARTR